MNLLLFIIAFKLVSLAGAIATTVAFVGLFAFRETLAVHVPWLFITGFTMIAIGEGCAWLIGKHAAKNG